jgi:hypothetical protein
LVYKGLGESIGSLQSILFRSREKVSTGQVLVRRHGQTLEPQLEHRIVPEAIGVIAIRIARGNLIDPLGQEVSQGMINIGQMALIMDRRGEAFGQTNLAVYSTQEERPKIRR